MNMKTRTIVLYISSQLWYFRQVLRGICRYARGTQGWNIQPVDLAQPTQLAMLRRVDPRALGLIGHVGDADAMRTLQTLGCPLVNISAQRLDLHLPRVGIDDALVGAMVARHFLERGFRHFAFRRRTTMGYSQLREQGFRAVIEARGLAVTCQEADARDGEVLAWLRGLPKPVAILGCDDGACLRAARVCADHGIPVPDEVALVGVDDDDLSCELCAPPLSSVRVPGEAIGYTAADLLHRLMAGVPPPAQPILLPPIGIITRRSSDTVLAVDPEVAAALRFIRDHAHQPIDVPDLIAAVPLSRRALEGHFQRELGRTPKEEIRRAHLERARNLLATTDLPLPDVATAAGFRSLGHMHVTFRKAGALTPAGYRKASRAM
jgi:LacI family transcriptional regulator